MLIEKRGFFEGMDGDTSQRLLSDKAALNIMNGRMTVSKYGRTGRVENVPGNTLVQQSVRPPYGQDQTIGSAVDLDSSRLIFFNYNTFQDHGIYCYDPSNNTIYAVLYDSQVLGGLGFSRNSLIHSARVENGCLYWCDSTNNEPRRIDINASIEMNHPGTFPEVQPYQYPMSQSVLYWIRRQPGLPLTFEKDTDAGYENNFIEKEAFLFSWRYIYRNYEISTLSGWSLLANYNVSGDTYNFISISAPLEETIDQDVIQVDFVAKFLNGGKSFVIKSWNTEITNDRNAIYQHNNDSIPLSFDFYNDTTGISLDDAYSVKPYDSVPIYAQTIEMARNRAFMCNYTIGYDTPILTSLTAEVQNSDIGTLMGVWIQVDNVFPGPEVFTYYFFCISDPIGYYTYTSDPPQATVDFTNLTLVASNPTAFEAYVRSTYPNGELVFSSEGSTSEVINGPPVPSLSGTTAFKSAATYQLSIHFNDHAGRKCGILTSDSLKLTIPEKEYSQQLYATGINWFLGNTNAINEIPEFAYSYSINITKCLTTRFFLDAKVKNITYVTKVVATGEYEFNTSAYSASANGIGIDITLLNAYGMGYTFADGDLVKVYKGTDVYILSIIAQEGNWIICELQNLGAIGNTASPYTTALFEIYTPYKPSTSEPHYEVAQIFEVTNPGTSSRQYSVLTGTIGGDITLLSRNDGSGDYITENMSPNDTYPYNWNTNSGRPNFIDTIGQQVKTNDIAYSDTYIQGGKVNGLSTFEALNTKSITAECGDISKLQLADKISEDQGNVMLAICEHQTASLYLGEEQLVGASSNAFVAQSSSVIGTINILKGSYGTTKPESVFEYLGLIFFFDLKNGCYVQYSVNGLDEVSKYRQDRFFKRYSDAYLEASMNNLDNINGFHHIRSIINPLTKEVLVTLPALIYENYAETLPSYSEVPSYATSIINRFDIYDQLGKVMSFMFQENKWGNNYEALPEWSEYLENKLYTFKNGDLYVHDNDTVNWNRFYGVNYPIRICFTGNLNPSAIKVLGSIALESNAIPDFTVAMTTFPNTQITDLAADDYTDMGGVYDATFFKDRLSPNSTGTADERLYTGDDLTDYVFYIMCEWQQYESLFFINFGDIGYDYSRGNKQIINPINS